jgi:hypothetical protein
MRFKWLLSAWFLVLSMCAGAQTTVSIAPDAPSKEDVQKLFDVMASREQMAQMMQQVFAQARTSSRVWIGSQRSFSRTSPWTRC